MIVGARETALMEGYPEIAWLEPQPVTGQQAGAPAITLLTCRFCTAMLGLRLQDLEVVGFANDEAFRWHLDAVHRP